MIAVENGIRNDSIYKSDKRTHMQQPCKRECKRECKGINTAVHTPIQSREKRKVLNVCISKMITKGKKGDEEEEEQ